MTSSSRAVRLASLSAAPLVVAVGAPARALTPNLTIENIEMTGASVPDQNGAGIRSEVAGLTVRRCYFHDNENGILSGADAASDIVIEDSEFANNDGTASYEIDLPEGGLAVIVGNGSRSAAGSLAALAVLLGARGLRRRRVRAHRAGVIGVLLVAALASGCGSDAVPRADLGTDARTALPCEGAQPVCRVMSTCGCDEVVTAIVGSTCGGGCCPWICPAWSVEERSCLDFCGVDGGRQDLGVRDSGADGAAGGDAGDVDAGSSDWRACTDQGQCRFASNTCCDACGVPTLGDLDAIRIGREGAHFAEVCATPDPACPDCVMLNAPPHLIATCAAGACAGIDVRTGPLSDCATDSDCRVRTTSCCECGGEARYIAIASSAESAYAALVCPAGTGCPECAPVYPATLIPRCGGDGHCTL